MHTRRLTCSLAATVLGGLLVLPGLVLPWGVSQTGRPAARPIAVTPLDRALKLIDQARARFAGVADYTCTVVKREMVNGKQMPENVIAMKVRNQPFSVHMKWQQPKMLQGQEAYYVAGKNNGMMRVKPPGLLGAMGFINMDVNDARARSVSRHSITEAGIANLIDRCARRWEQERKLNRTRVRIGEFEFDGRRCTAVETLNLNSKPGEVYAYRSLVYFDKELLLPVRTEAYDWPREGQTEGELMDCLSILDLKLNVNLPEDAFNR